MKKFRTIFLDMDGMLVNFHLEAIRAHIRMGRRFPHIHTGDPLQLGWQQLHARWPTGLSLQKFMSQGLAKKITGDEFWAPIDIDPMFWRNIPPYPNYKEIVELLQEYCHDLILCTSPHNTPDSYGGKYQWLRINKLDHLPVIMIKQKWRLADPTALLIDDFEEHIKAWRRELRIRWGIEGFITPSKEDSAPCGVFAILYPQPWNANYTLKGDQLPFVKRTMDFYLQQTT